MLLIKTDDLQSRVCYIPYTYVSADGEQQKYSYILSSCSFSHSSQNSLRLSGTLIRAKAMGFQPSPGVTLRWPVHEYRSPSGSMSIKSVQNSRGVPSKPRFRPSTKISPQLASSRFEHHCNGVTLTICFPPCSLRFLQASKKARPHTHNASKALRCGAVDFCNWL